MDFQIKLFNWQDKGNHLIILARGPMDRRAFQRLFEEIETAAEGLKKCKVLVDLSDSSYQIDGTEIKALAGACRFEHWPADNKVALVSSSEISDYHRLHCLRTKLVERGLTIGVFHASKIAIDWLAGVI